MSEPKPDLNIEALLERQPGEMSSRDISTLKDGLLTTTRVLEEVAFYEQAMAWGRTDARAAHAAILARDVPDQEPAFPEMRLATLAWLVQMIQREEKPVEIRDMMREVEQQQAASRLVDRAREAAFRADPGRWLDDARALDVPMLRANGCWIASRDGETLLCVHASSVCNREAQETVTKAYDRALRDDFRTVIIVGAPGLTDRIELPDPMTLDLMEIYFETVEIPGADVTGPAPTTGGRAA